MSHSDESGTMVHHNVKKGEALILNQIKLTSTKQRKNTFLFYVLVQATTKTRYEILHVCARTHAHARASLSFSADNDLLD